MTNQTISTKIIISNDRVVINLDLIEFQFLVKALEYPADFDLKKVIKDILEPNTKIVKKEPTVYVQKT